MMGLLWTAGCNATTVADAGGTSSGTSNGTTSSTTSGGAASAGSMGGTTTTSSSSSSGTSGSTTTSSGSSGTSGSTSSSSTGGSSSSSSTGSSSSSSSTGGTGGHASSPNAYFDTVVSTVQEARTTVNVEVALTAPSDQAITVPYGVGGTAESGRDFAPLSGSVTLAAGTTHATIAIALQPNGDITGDLTLTLTLQAPTHANLGTDTLYTLTIQDADTMPVAQNGNLVGYPGATVHGLLASNVLDSNVAVQYALVDDGQLGSVTITDAITGAYTYAAGSTLGPDSFTFTVTALGATSAPATIGVHVVTAPVPVITPPADAVYHSRRGPLQQGVQGVFTATADANATAPIECMVTTPFLDLADPSSIPAAIPCDQLPSLVTDANGATHLGAAAYANGALTWTPPRSQRGAYAFQLSVQGYGAPGSADFVVTVADALPGAAPAHVLDASLTDAPLAGHGAIVAPGVANNVWGGWPDLVGVTTGVSAGFSSNPAPWIGTGTGADPYALLLNPFGAGPGDSVQWPVSATGSYRISAWLSPAAGNLPGAVVLSNVDAATGKGLVLRQSAFTPDVLELSPSVANPNYAALILGDGPNAFWRFEETTSPFTSSVNDANGLTASFDATVSTPGAGAVGNGADFTSLSVPPQAYDPNGLLLPASPLSPQGQVSVEAWVNVASTGVSEVFVSNASDDSSNGYALGLDNDSFTFAVGDMDTASADVAVGPSGFTPNAYTHLVGTYDGSTLALYVNGVQVATASSSRALGSNQALTLGAQPDGSRPFTGSLDEIAVYGYVLSPPQVRHHYQAGTPGAEPLLAANAIDGDGPLGHWPLHEAAGTLAADSSPSSNAAALAGVGLAVEQHDGANAVGFADAYGVVVQSSLAYETADATFEAWIHPDWAAAQSQGDEAIFSMNARSNDAKRVLMLLSPSATPGFDGVTVTGGQYNGAVFSAPMRDGVWHHIVFTESSGTAAFYVDGVLADTHPSPKDPSVTDTYLLIGNQPGYPGRPFHGAMQDVAMYDFALSPADVARHFREHSGAACQTHTRMPAGQYHNVAVDFDSATQTSTLWVDGLAECSLHAAGGGGTLWVGADPNQENFWSGSVAQLQSFATAPGKQASYANFAGAADRFRAQPEGDIVTPFETAARSGPVYSFDAANAQGLHAYVDALGHCAGDYSVWKNLGSASRQATLQDFLALGQSKCGASSPEGNMWQGTGTVSDPYALRYAIQYDKVTLPSDTTDWTHGMSFEVWAKTTAGQGLPRFVEMASRPESGDNIIFWRTGKGFAQKGTNSLILSVYDPQGAEHRAFSEEAVVDDEWHQYAVVAQQDSPGVVSYHFFRDGRELQIIDSDLDPILPHSIARPNVLIGHSNFQSDDPFVGALGIVRVYDRALRLADVQQNCAASAPRFGVQCQ